MEDQLEHGHAIGRIDPVFQIPLADLLSTLDVAEIAGRPTVVSAAHHSLLVIQEADVVVPTVFATSHQAELVSHVFAQRFAIGLVLLAVA